VTTLGNRRSTVVMYSDPECIYCHRVRLVLAEKDIQADIVSIDPQHPPADLKEVNPGQSVPTLIDRDLVLYDAKVIIDYLDERYPHPPFMPIDPVSRGRTRLALFSIERDWYSLIGPMAESADSRAEAGKRLSESLTASAEVFAAMPFFLSEEYSILDATLAPLLWRLPHYGIVLPQPAAPVADYARRLLARRGFEKSLSPQEREMI